MSPQKKSRRSKRRWEGRRHGGHGAGYDHHREHRRARCGGAREGSCGYSRRRARCRCPVCRRSSTRLQQLLSDPEVGIPQWCRSSITNRCWSAACCRWQLRRAQPDAAKVTDSDRGHARRFRSAAPASLAYAMRQVSQAHRSRTSVRTRGVVGAQRVDGGRVVRDRAQVHAREPRSRVSRRAHARRRQAVHPHARRAFPVRVARPNQVRGDPAQVACAVRARDPDGLAVNDDVIERRRAITRT